jgi:uroporphyrinogen-III synthase
VTRPEPEASALVEELLARGMPARALPALAREAIPGALDGLDGELCVVSSASVLPALLARWPGGSGAPPLAAMAPRSAARLSAAGFRVALAAQGGSLALAGAIGQSWEALGRPCTLLWPTSDAGAASAEQLAARGILGGLTARDDAPPRLVVVPCVRLLPVQGLREAIAGALREAGPGGVAGEHPRPMNLLFHAPSAVRAWLDAWPNEALPPRRVAGVGGSTLRALRALAPAGWPAPLEVPLEGLPEALARWGTEP